MPVEGHSCPLGDSIAQHLAKLQWLLAQLASLLLRQHQAPLLDVSLCLERLSQVPEHRQASLDQVRDSNQSSCLKRTRSRPCRNLVHLSGAGNFLCLDISITST